VSTALEAVGLKILDETKTDELLEAVRRFARTR
jgi:hypothetical protein